MIGPGPMEEEDSVPKQTLPEDCLATFILCLQEAGRSMHLRQEMAETILAMIQQFLTAGSWEVIKGVEETNEQQDLHVLTTLGPEGAQG